MSSEEYRESCYGEGIQKRPVVKCDKLSMKVIETYPCARDAEKKFGFHKNTIANCCRKRIVSKGQHVWRFADDWDPMESFDGKKYRPVEVVDNVTGERRFFSSSQATARALGIPPIAVTQTLANGLTLLNRYTLRHAR